MATGKTVSEQREALLLEKELLEMETLRETVAQQRAKKEASARRQQTQIDAMRQAELDIKRRQVICNHKKGGKDLPGITRGTDANYSVNSHRYSTGVVQVMCTRCGKEWLPGDVDYEIALAYPTDNSPSEAVIFGIPTAALTQPK